MTAPISIRYEDWVAVIDDATKAQERVKKLEDAIKRIRQQAQTDNTDHTACIIILAIINEIARKALEE